MKKCPGPYCHGAGKPNVACACLLCKTCCIKASLAYGFLRKCKVASHKEGLDRNLTVVPQIPTSVSAGHGAAASSTLGFNPTPIGAYLSSTYIQSLEASSALRAARLLEADRARQARVEADSLRVFITWWDKASIGLSHCLLHLHFLEGRRSPQICRGHDDKRYSYSPSAQRPLLSFWSRPPASSVS